MLKFNRLSRVQIRINYSNMITNYSKNNQIQEPSWEPVFPYISGFFTTFLFKWESDFLLNELLRAILRRKPFLALPPYSARPRLTVELDFSPGLITAKSSATSRVDVGRRSSKTSDALNRCPGFDLEERRRRILLVSLRENREFDFSSSFCLSDSLESVGEGMGLSLEKLGTTGLLSDGETSRGGGRLCRLVSGLLGSEHDLWRATWEK